VSLIKNLPTEFSGLHEVPRKKLYAGGLRATVNKLRKKMTVSEYDEWNRFFAGVEATSECSKCEEVKVLLNKNRSNHLDDDDVAKAKRRIYNTAKKDLQQHTELDKLNHPDVTEDDEPWVLRKFRAYRSGVVESDPEHDDDIEPDEDDDINDIVINDNGQGGSDNDVGDTNGWINVFGSIAITDTSKFGTTRVKGSNNRNATDNVPLRIGDLVFLTPETEDTWRKFTVAVLIAYHPIREMMHVYWLDVTQSHREKQGATHSKDSVYSILLRDPKKDQIAYAQVHPRANKKEGGGYWAAGTYDEWVETAQGKTKWPRELAITSVESLFHWENGHFGSLIWQSGKLKGPVFSNVSNRMRAFRGLQQLAPS
jgi:hypothetical protein